MFQLYRSHDIPPYLDATAQTLLAEGRAAFHAYGHASRRIFAHDTETLLFPWRGDRIMNTLAAVLGTHGLRVGQDGLALTISSCTPTRLLDAITDLAAGPPPDPVATAATVRAKQHDKYDRYLGEHILDLGYAARALDIPGAWAVLRELATG
jgi:ATP-dependent Lhr-like helicase